MITVPTNHVGVGDQFYVIGLAREQGEKKMFVDFNVRLRES